VQTSRLATTSWSTSRSAGRPAVVRERGTNHWYLTDTGEPTPPRSSRRLQIQQRSLVDENSELCGEAWGHAGREGSSGYLSMNPSGSGVLRCVGSRYVEPSKTLVQGQVCTLYEVPASAKCSWASPHTQQLRTPRRVSFEAVGVVWTRVICIFSQMQIASSVRCSGFSPVQLASHVVQSFKHYGENTRCGHCCWRLPVESVWVRCQKNRRYIGLYADSFT
jgi:hypothetical protein